MNVTRDDVWVDALAGRGDDGSIDAAEGRTLRQAIVTRTSFPELAADAEDRRREAELLARARRDGIIPARSKTPEAFLLGWRAGVAAVAAAAVIGAVGLFYVRQPVPIETVRGDDGVIRVEAADPAAFQNDLIRDLRGAGVQATGYEMLGRVGVDADLPQPLPSEIRRIMERRGIPLPQDGTLRVEIRSPSKR